MKLPSTSHFLYIVWTTLYIIKCTNNSSWVFGPISRTYDPPPRSRRSLSVPRCLQYPDFIKGTWFLAMACRNFRGFRTSHGWRGPLWSLTSLTSSTNIVIRRFWPQSASETLWAFPHSGINSGYLPDTFNLTRLWWVEKYLLFSKFGQVQRVQLFELFQKNYWWKILGKINVYLPRLGFLLGSTNSIDTLEEAEQQGGLKMWYVSFQPTTAEIVIRNYLAISSQVKVYLSQNYWVWVWRNGLQQGTLFRRIWWVEGYSELRILTDTTC